MLAQASGALGDRDRAPAQAAGKEALVGSPFASGTDRNMAGLLHKVRQETRREFKSKVFKGAWDWSPGRKQRVAD